VRGDRERLVGLDLLELLLEVARLAARILSGLAPR
jgi:hypothetical protein